MYARKGGSKGSTKDGVEVGEIETEGGEVEKVEVDEWREERKVKGGQGCRKLTWFNGC
jgi:hypothetical protein